MANRPRGEIEAELGGTRYRLRLTLGALAELEAAFAADDLAALAARFGTGRLSARQLAAILGAGLRGAGHDIADETVLRLAHPEGAAGFVRLAAELLAAAFGADDPPRPPPAGTAAAPDPASCPGRTG